jgi:sugar transferase (PEP-CTERM/EpsH1 system associated)
VKVLFLAHRAPWPPDKGDRIRSHALLAHLARRHEVFLGAFADERDPAGARALADHLRPLCADLCILPRPSRLRAVRAAITGRPLSFEALASGAMDAFVTATARRVRPDAALGYSGQTIPWLLGLSGMRRVVDLVDVDSAKWAARGRRTKNPLYALEARRVRRFERRAIRELDAVLVISSREADLLGGESESVRILRPGVDFGRTPCRERDPGNARMGFVGALDYSPNAEAAWWFARDVLPRIRAERPDAEFVVIGRHPPDGLRGLPGVTVTGHVRDLDALMHGLVLSVVPVLDSHGVQNKALQSMALGVPVVMTPDPAAGLEIRPGEHALVAGDATEFAASVLRLIDNAGERARLSAAGRRFVESRCDWDTNVTVLDELLTGAAARAREPGVQRGSVEHAVGRTIS